MNIPYRLVERVTFSSPYFYLWCSESCRHMVSSFFKSQPADMLWKLNKERISLSTKDRDKMYRATMTGVHASNSTVRHTLPSFL